MIEKIIIHSDEGKDKLQTRSIQELRLKQLMMFWYVWCCKFPHATFFCKPFTCKPDMISVKYYQGYRNMQILANCNNPLRKLCRKLCETRSNGNVKLGSNQLQPYHVFCTIENKNNPTEC